MVTGLPDEPVGMAAHWYFTSGYVLVMAGSSQPPSNVIAACFLPSEVPHQLSPMSAALMPRPFLNRSMYHWTAFFEASESIVAVFPSSETTEPPWAYTKARPRSRPGLRHIGA